MSSNWNTFFFFPKIKIKSVHSGHKSGLFYPVSDIMGASLTNALKLLELLNAFNGAAVIPVSFIIVTFGTMSLEPFYGSLNLSKKEAS